MKVAIGADHRGFEQKRELSQKIRGWGHEVMDCGSLSTEPCDYPEIAFKVAAAVGEAECERGILLCMSGVGMCIAANKVTGIRAALCKDAEIARLSRQHNDANVLVLAAGRDGRIDDEIVHAWLTTEFEGGRHQRRVDRITEFEQKKGKP
ncbi:MAG: ribose 5-phosphate isomerase B [Candidatus Omnitrophica bacterium]|nr:ribose 5-phosphate isomerase B [Candidatus Omnitrophota bacterium]